uniref:Band 7 domain-containing protein n=1 Tax=Haptolina ericina TaxID=156174 RepID=A0A7S3B848_9EUKA
MNGKQKDMSSDKGNGKANGTTSGTNVEHKEHVWDSPAYERLLEHGLLRTDWRKPSVDALEFKDGNATPGGNVFRRLACIAFPPAGYFLNTVEVPAGCVRKMQNGRGGFEFIGNRGKKQGVHAYWDAFYRIEKRNDVLLADGEKDGLCIHNGDCWIVVVPQGFVGLAMDMGQPVLLPPGMHQWRSATMKFEANIDLNQPVIIMGPYTLLTVDKGYEAVTQNNGQQQVLPGGNVHLLTHRNWKFEKFITCKIQTDNLQRIEVMTGDNVLMHCHATVCWSITDVQRCAEKAAETMNHVGNSKSGKKTDAGTIDKLRNDVLKQAEASLSALVGKVNFSNTFSAATALQVGQTPLIISDAEGLEGGVVEARRLPKSVDSDVSSLLFDVDKLKCSVAHANDMTTRYGVGIISINIISAKPADDQLMACLAKGAVAAAEAQQLETIALGRAKAATIDARGIADALKISAQADAEAEVTRAEGSKQAASLLNEQEVAVMLATISATGAALKNAQSNLILGSDASNIGSMLMSNPDYTSKLGLTK